MRPDASCKLEAIAGGVYFVANQDPLTPEVVRGRRGALAVDGTQCLKVCLGSPSCQRRPGRKGTIFAYSTWLTSLRVEVAGPGPGTFHDTRLALKKMQRHDPSTVTVQRQFGKFLRWSAPYSLFNGLVPPTSQEQCTVYRTALKIKA